MEVCKPCHYAMVEAVEPLKLHPTSMSYVDKWFEHLQLLWMNIWLHTNTVTITDVYPELGELTEVLCDGSVQTMLHLFN
jgi:hypothetical protein